MNLSMRSPRKLCKGQTRGEMLSICAPNHDELPLPHIRSDVYDVYFKLQTENYTCWQGWRGAGVLMHCW